MQLLTQTTVSDFASFKSDFDADMEKRMNAGLTLLQMWHDADDANTVLCLFNVNDRARAKARLEAEAQTTGNLTGRFLKTA